MEESHNRFRESKFPTYFHYFYRFLNLKEDFFYERNMPPKLNFFPVNLKEENKLKVWRNPKLSGEELHNLKPEYDCIYFKRKSGKNLAIPYNEEGVSELASLGFRPTKVIPNDNPRLFASLIKHGFIRHLLQNELKFNGSSFNLEPLYYSEPNLEKYNFESLYRKDSPLHRFENLDLVEGLRVRSYFFNFQTSGFVIGLSLSYTTTYTFDAGLSELLEGIDISEMPEFYVQRKTPPKCDEKCKLYGESRLLGRFKGFSDDGEGCKSTEKYVELENSRVDFNVPASRVVFERKPHIIQRWGKLKGEKNLLNILVVSQVWLKFCNSSF